jgi:hypothetical protein
MRSEPWYPYAPDQAFGRRGARDDELVDTLVAQLDSQRRPPRAANRAAPEPRPSQLAVWQPRGWPLRWGIGHQPDVPATAAAALEAAPRLRERDDG